MKQKNLLMHQKSKEQLIDWAKAALKRQQDWQQEVKLRWGNQNSFVKTV